MKQTIKTGYGKKRGALSSTGLIPGFLTGILTLLLTVSVSALLLGKGILPMERVGVLAKLLYGAAVTAGSFLTAKKARSAKLLWTMLFGALLCGLTVTAAFFLPGERELRVGSLLAVTAAGILLGGLPGARGKRSGYV